MNKISLVSALALVLAYSNLAFAGFKDDVQNAGGFNGPNIAVASVAEAQKMKDDAAIVLEGKIEKSLGNEEYLFSDATGSIVVEIDNDNWKGLTVTPKDVVVLKGEVEKDIFKTEIDVDVVELKK